MEEDEAALLAELRAISQKSAASRFDDTSTCSENDLKDVATEETVNEGLSFPPSPTAAAATTSEDAVAVAVAETTTAVGTTTTSAKEELKATLLNRHRNSPSIPRSPKSSTINSASNDAVPEQEPNTTATAATSNINNNNNNNDNNNTATSMSPSPKAASAAAPRATLPWKRKKKVQQAPDVIVAAPASPQPPPPNTTKPRDNNPQQQQQQRSGPAEDPELLALLRGVSSKSTGASRFDGGDGDDLNANTTTTTATTDKESIAAASAEPNGVTADSSESSSSPKKLALPWKRHPPKRENQPNDTTTTATTATEDPQQQPSCGIKSEIPSTFQGERGGAAEDAELLALLRGVSAKSGSASRFNDDDNDGDSTDNANEGAQNNNNTPATSSTNGAAAAAAAAGVVATKPSEEKGTSAVASEPKLALPWKQKRNPQRAQQAQEVEVLVAAPPPPAKPAASPSASGRRKDSPKQKQQQPKYGIKSELPSTFQGERGGAAEDAELLALLRGVSSKAGASSRFDDGNDGDNDNRANHNAKTDAPTEPAPAPIHAAVEKAAEPKSKQKQCTPPWRRKDRAPVTKQPEVDLVVASPPAAPAPDIKPAPELTSEPSAETSQQPSPTYGIKSDLPSTFQGERGGAAEDAELLALLRGVSSKASTSRFDDVVDGDGVGASGEAAPQTTTVPTDTAPASPPRPAATKSNERLTPPWKRGRVKQAPKKQPEIDVVVAAPPAPPRATSDTLQPNKSANEPILAEPKYGIKSDIPSTFQGERGGAAEDAELLALLRGVSSKSGASRFDENAEEIVSATDAPASSSFEKSKPAPVAQPKSQRNGGSLPPWKRGGNKVSSVQPVVEVVVEKVNRAEPTSADEAPQYGIKSNLPSTFQGERGGAAEDAELLALLRGVNAQSAASRFSDEPSGPAAATDRSSEPSPGTHPVSSALDRSPGTAAAFPTPTVQGASTSQEECLVTRDTVASSLSDKNWKVRSQAYDILSSILKEAADSANNLIDSEIILEGLDDSISTFMEDSNASALDKALEFALLYAEYCRGAGDSERAGRIVSSLLKKNAFSSRPTTLKLASSLVLKLMEVGSEGVSSVHSVVDVLLKEGLASRKPKVIHASATLILDAAVHYGAATLPLASISDYAPKMLSHSNPKVRENAVKILAEMCRVLGSKAPLQGVVDNMKKAQLSELDSLLSSQPEPTPVQTGLRSQSRGSGSASSEDALAAMQAGAKELEAQRFAARPAVDLVAAVAKTEYAKQIDLPKWSQKVAALNAVIECGGEKPYKLAQPSSSVNYKPLVVDMRKLLSHTHFAVCSKAMEVMSMLAEGVGEKLFPLLRPTLTTLLQIAKDKKLTKAVSSCLDSFFGNVLGFDHLLEKDDAIPFSLDERQQKNALARATALEFLGRCVERNESAGPRGSLSVHSARNLTVLCTEKLGDSDASVRKAAMDVFQRMQELNDENIVDVVRKSIAALKTSNARAYKTLAKNASATNEKASTSGPPTGKSNAPNRSRSAAPGTKPSSVAASAEFTRVPKKKSALAEKAPVAMSDVSIPHLEEALVHVSSLHIPQWDAPDEEGGILEGLKASKWLLRQDAIKSLTAFIESGHLIDSKNVDKDTSSILLVVREQTRGFNETNVNIMKAIIQLFVAVCGFVECKEDTLVQWAVRDGAAVCVQRISDRKLSDLCKSLLTALCVVALPSSILLVSFETIKSVKSPVAHEEFLKWFRTFCIDFGAATMGPEISEILPHLIEELGSSSVKVQREATACFALLHQQIGPQLKALSLSLAKNQKAKTQLEKCFDDNPFNPSNLTEAWPKESIAFQNTFGEGPSQPSQGGLAIEVPKTDVLSLLPNDIIERLGSKDGKTAWKMRKAALEEIELAVTGCSGLIDTNASIMKDLVELMRGLRDRLSDTQINLRPIAARIVGSMLAAVERNCQAKLGKVVFAPLINIVMNDIKKPLRDASLAAIQAGVKTNELDGGGLNELALENFVGAVVTEVNEASTRAGGLPDVLLLLYSFVDHLPNLDNIVSARGQSLGEKYAVMIVESLTSSKTETRSAAQSLLEASFKNEIVGLESLRKAQGSLKPAKQRSVAPIVTKIMQNSSCLKPYPSHNTTPKSSEPPSTLAVGSRQKERGSGPPGAITMLPSDQNKDVPPRGSRHPLVPRSGKHIAESTKSILWPVFPEEPHGSVLGNLKRFWAPHLPAASASALFPATGIKKQDDAKIGCELLSRAVAIDRSENTVVVEEQLDLILKWTIFALCRKETTTGQQDILALIRDIFEYMVEIKREFTDSEAVESVPFILEKASMAKGRFRDMYSEITALAESEFLLPPKRLGAVVCAAMMDGSTHAKSRASACETCLACVEKAGLAGVGKKGVLSAAKLLSQETTKYRVSALDLMEVILSKMNNDMQRLVRICGPNLTDKGRQLLEERLAQGRPTRGSSPAPARTPAHQQSPRGSPVKSHKTGERRSTRSSGREPDIYDELPKLSLRSWSKAPRNGSPQNRDTGFESSDDPFAFSLSAFRDPLPVSDLEEVKEALPTKHEASKSVAKTNFEPSGAAALLRARLLKIRGSGSMPEQDVGAVGSFDGSRTGAGTFDSVSAQQSFEAEVPASTPSAALTDFDAHLDIIRLLLEKNAPVLDRDDDLTACIISLKVFHAALARQQHSSVGVSSDELVNIRMLLMESTDLVVDLLRRLIAFAFRSGEENVNAGMLLPLLSLCLATLMALFRDVEFGSAVSTEELTLLLRETGVALLDPRLSSDQLSEETGSQMVRAINKLAVQAATGASRYAAFQALMTLQLQLNLNEGGADSPSDEDDAFTHRLSRVMTKLFARVIRAEEGNESPYTQGGLDMEALLCAAEDYLSVCHKAELEESAPVESVEICSDMVKTLIISILDSHGSSDALRRLMKDIEIHENSALGGMLTICEVELGMSPTQRPFAVDVEVSPSSTSPSRQPKTPSRDVAVLVSKLGSATAGAEREAALQDIRRYKVANGDEEIRAHLQQLSGPFREYIEEQLSKDDDTGPTKSAPLGFTDTGTSSVSERIRNLRSRLQVTEVAVQNAIEDKAHPPDPSNMPNKDLPQNSQSPPRLSAPKQSRLAAPTPSRLSSVPSKLPTPPSHSRIHSASSSSEALRERLAARREGTDNTSRAAALRARLEAVKQHSQQQQP